jgi:hypothetical protein
MTKIRKQEQEQGKKNMQRQLDAQARELGFANHAALLEDVKKRKNGRGPRNTPPPAHEDVDNDDEPQTPAAVPAAARTNEPNDASGKARQRAERREQQRRERELEDRRRANRARATAEKKAKLLERRLQQQEAETELTVAAVRNGVQDVDYALHFLRKRLAKMSPKELETFDEDAFFKVTLRKTHPHLYQVVEQLADTTPTTNTPSPKVETPPAPNGKVDANKMSGAEYDAELRKRGFTPPRLGMPS